MVADIVELSVGIEEESTKVVGERHAGVEAEAEGAVASVAAIAGKLLDSEGLLVHDGNELDG